ncbi:signal peptidase I [Allosaccharopolyspora coralli]|uniref:Signal peptidase I n=1 Tax=Allosaccharopolyspora coralli TaxID=2665642 RepID=A0A5Q3QCS8_9PSEU|nr:signal peptidase I [Allosaccharopolyspora coralli]QGK71034.1 signal peptidase I [Allosaccharopolyspora coralli]
MADVVRSGGYDDEPPEGERAAGAQQERGRKSKKKGSFWRELPILIVTALVLTVLIQAFLARVYVIPSQSMEQTLHGCPGCSNDRVLVDKVSYHFTDPQPGDVVVFRGPDSWGQNDFDSPEPTNPVAQFFQGAASLIGMGAPDEKDFVKRVIATGGQTVECCDSENRVLVDGNPLNEDAYLFYEQGRGTEQKEFEPVTVPDGHLWVMGDNRNDSADSRYQGGGGENGAVPVDNVIGKAQVIVLPPTRWQSIPEPDPQAVALGAPAWQSGAPLGVGLAAAFPVVWTGRKLRTLVVDRRSREQF